jgi:hypothetical protein
MNGKILLTGPQAVYFQHLTRMLGGRYSRSSSIGKWLPFNGDDSIGINWSFHSLIGSGSTFDRPRNLVDTLVVLSHQ